MSVEEVVVRMQSKPYILAMGARKISRWLRCDVDEVREARRIVRNIVGKIHKGITEGKKPKILIFDLETSPLQAYVWGMWKQFIPLDMVSSQWFLLGYSCKWLGEDEVYSNILTPKEISDENDFRLVVELWEYLDLADYVIAHNGKRFDVPSIKARFLVHNLPPTSYYQQIDTLEVAKKEFRFASNSLDALARSFGYEGKKPHNAKLWAECMKGDMISLKYMEEYNRQDVVVLERVYLRMRPWIKSHPNFNLYTDTNEALCPACGSDAILPKGHYFTQTGKYETYECNGCGAISRKRKSIIPKEKNLLVSIPGR